LLRGDRGAVQPEAVTVCLGGEAEFPDTRQQLRRNSYAGIFDGNFELVAHKSRANRDTPPASSFAAIASPALAAKLTRICSSL
jgi:hypothetical protein